MIKERGGAAEGEGRSLRRRELLTVSYATILKVNTEDFSDIDDFGLFV